MNSCEYSNFLKHSAKVFLFLALVITLVANPRNQVSLAQEEQPSNPVYIIQEGDSLWEIAARFGINLLDLQQANGIANPNQIVVGDQIILPGIEGIQGVLDTQPVTYGESLRSLTRRYQVSTTAFPRINRLTIPTELYSGFSLIVPEQGEQSTQFGRVRVASDSTLLEIAVLNGSDPWQIANANLLPSMPEIIPGDVLLIPGKAKEGPGALPEVIEDITLDPGTFLQGKAALIDVETRENLSLSGTLMEHELQFYPADVNRVAALQGIHALAESGVYPLEIRGDLETGGQFSYMQWVRVMEVNYPYDEPLTVNPATIDPAVTQPEDAQWRALATPSTPERYWASQFLSPSPLDVEYCLQTGDCWASGFGNRRSYNGSAYNSFHTGLDIVGKTGTEIYAPADGFVVFAGPLTVRGNATMINHGQGVYTGYMHQEEILVKAGDFVKAGQLIGKVGGTGRVQGPHLHWEVWVNGVQVDPIDWLERVYP